VSATQKLLRFGVFELNLASEELRKAGTLVKLPHLPFKLLVLLASHAGQVVTRDEIQAQLWGAETFVDFEQGVNKCIKQIRMALSDNADNPLYIETLPRHGYRFLAPVVSKAIAAPVAQITTSQSGIQSRIPLIGVTPQPSNATMGRSEGPNVPTSGTNKKAAPVDFAPNSVRWATDTTASSQHAGNPHLSSAQRYWILCAAMLLVGAAIVFSVWRLHPQTRHQKILAVLPFDTTGQDAATGALARGLTETVSAKLVQASDSDFIQVVSPRDLRDRGVITAEDARREFGTDLVLESSLQRSGQTIRINCYLVDSKTHRQLAAKTITADVTDIFALQDRVVDESLDMLPVRVEAEQRRRLKVRQETQPGVYEAYIRGRGYLQEYEKPENIDGAISAFNEAATIDPNYALAYAGLGKAYWTGYEQFSKGNDWVANATRSCETALSLNTELVEGHVCLGNVFNGTGKYDKAVGEFQRAVQSDPAAEDALRGLADTYTNLGNFAAAESTYEKAIAVRPNYWGVYNWLGLFYYNQARYSDAAAMFLKATQLAPDNYKGYTNLGGAYVMVGSYSEGVAALKRSIDLRPNSDAYANLGYTYFLMRRFSDAAEVSEQALKLDDRNWEIWGNLADALYWNTDRRTQASDAYRKAITSALSSLEVNPRDAITLAYLADYYAMTDDQQSATSHIQRALSVAPSNGEVLFRSAIVYNHFNQTEESLSYLEKAANAGYSRTVIRDTPDFERLREGSRFQALLTTK
jgi:tetratricopeptide (TPR) repeat protein/DNA-binding winged helix-turn-helix (wHTH) protein